MKNVIWTVFEETIVGYISHFSTACNKIFNHEIHGIFILAYVQWNFIKKSLYYTETSATTAIAVVCSYLWWLLLQFY